jgi:8-oxo-dGTP pyrophosphatase MutT (NUDIX family)
MDVGVPHLFEK